MGDEFDVVCVGGGGTGLAGAVTAAEAGARVLVLEKRHVLGGNSTVASGIFAAESPTHQRLNIVAPREELFRAAVEYSHWTVNPRLLRAFVDRSPETIEWLEGLGVEFEWVTPLFEGQTPPVWHVPRGGGSTMVDAIVARAEELGVKILVDAPVVGIERDEAGNFKLEYTEGEERTVVSTKCVLIGTGGYGGNAEMLAEHCPDYEPDSWFCSGLRHDGDGIRMADGLGAAADGFGLCEFHAPSVQGPLFLSLALRDPATLILNSRGRRFFDEAIVDNAFEAANALRRQPGQVAFGILDARMRDAVLAKAANKSQGPLYEDQMNNTEQFRKLLDGVSGTRGGVANSIEEVAAIVGGDPEVVAGSIAEYNRFCASGYDEDFGKNRRYLQAVEQAPFYVLRGRVGYFNTIGGIKVSERLEVVDDGESPVPGLYAGGVDVGGWQGDTYNFTLAGGSLGFAFNSGRIAGRNAAEYALKTAG